MNGSSSNTVKLYSNGNSSYGDREIIIQVFDYETYLPEGSLINTSNILDIIEEKKEENSTIEYFAIDKYPGWIFQGEENGLTSLQVNVFLEKTFFVVSFTSIYLIGESDIAYIKKLAKSVEFLKNTTEDNSIYQSVDDIDFSSEEAVMEYFKKQGTSDIIEGIWVQHVSMHNRFVIMNSYIKIAVIKTAYNKFTAFILEGNAPVFKEGIDDVPRDRGNDEIIRCDNRDWKCGEIKYLFEKVQAKYLVEEYNMWVNNHSEFTTKKSAEKRFWSIINEKELISDGSKGQPFYKTYPIH